MNVIRLGILGLLLAGLCLADASGQDQKSKFGKFKFNKGSAPSAPLTAESMSAPLVAPDVLAKLQLTAQQKPVADKLMQEFAAKNKELSAKLPASPTTPSTPFGKFKGAFGKGKGGTATALPPELQAVLSLRLDYEKRFEELLTEPQKKIYDQELAKKAEALLTGNK